MRKGFQIVASFGFSVIFIGSLLDMSIRSQRSVGLHYQVFRAVVSIAGAGATAAFPGFSGKRWENVLRVFASLVVLTIFYFLAFPVEVPSPEAR